MSEYFKEIFRTAHLAYNIGINLLLLVSVSDRKLMMCMNYESAYIE